MTNITFKQRRIKTTVRVDLPVVGLKVRVKVNPDLKGLLAVEPGSEWSSLTSLTSLHLSPTQSTSLCLSLSRSHSIAKE